MVKVSKKGNMFTQNGILMHRDRIFGHELSQMLVPDQRRSQVLKMAHDTAGHMSWKNTLKRVEMNFIWPKVRTDTIKYVKSCDIVRRKQKLHAGIVFQ